MREFKAKVEVALGDKVVVKLTIHQPDDALKSQLGVLSGKLADVLLRDAQTHMTLGFESDDERIRRIEEDAARLRAMRLDMQDGDYPTPPENPPEGVDAATGEVVEPEEGEPELTAEEIEGLCGVTEFTVGVAGPPTATEADMGIPDMAEPEGGKNAATLELIRGGIAEEDDPLADARQALVDRGVLADEQVPFEPEPGEDDLPPDVEIEMDPEDVTADAEIAEEAPAMTEVLQEFAAMLVPTETTDDWLRVFLASPATNLHRSARGLHYNYSTDKKRLTLTVGDAPSPEFAIDAGCRALHMVPRGALGIDLVKQTVSISLAILSKSMQTA